MTANYAGFWRRVIAFFADMIIISIIQIPINTLLTPDPDTVTKETLLILSLMTTLLSVVISILYYVVYQSRNGQTLGKKVMGIKVVNMNGQVPPMGAFFLREVIGKFLSGLILGIGFLWMLWDPRKQTLHDKIAGTFVIKI